MRYEDAAKIGSSVEGYVRCTYVRMNDSKEGYIYSLQHHDACKVTDAHLGAEEFFDGEKNYGGGAASDQVQQDIINTADYSVFVEDIPVVEAVAPFAAWGKTKMIECKLTAYAKDMIYRKIESDYRRQKKYFVEKVWIKDVTVETKNAQGNVVGAKLHKAGERQVMIDTYDHDKAYSKEFLKYGIGKSKEDAFIAWYKATGKGQTVAPVSSELAIRIRDNKNGYMYVITEYYPTITGHFNELQEQCLANVLDKDATFIVKECAIDWFPTKIDGAFITDKDGKLVTIDVALANAKKRLDRAKAILAATATFAII